MKMRLLKILLLILIQNVFQSCSSANIIEPLNGLRFAHLNKEYSLVCHYGPGQMVEWMDAHHYIDIRFNCRSSGTEGSKTTKLFQDAVTYCNHTTKTSTLLIRNITRAHNGSIVKCITEDKEEEFQINVSASTDPSPFLITTFSHEEIFDGQDVEVKCRWNLEDVAMKVKLKCGDIKKDGNGSASLKLILTKEWNNKYCICEGFYYGTRTVSHHPITVFSAPQVSVNNATVFAGSMAVLNCSASEGYPEIYSYLGWHHSFNNVIVEKRPASNKEGSLVIPNTTWQDAGTWVCFVTNGKYNQSSQGYLNITGPPILQALNSKVKATCGTSRRLEVQIFPFYDNIDITWKHNGQKISKGTPGKISSAWQQTIKGQEVYLSGLTVSLRLNDIQPKDAGNYSVIVETKDGSNRYSFRMQISEKTDVTLITAGLICGSLALIFLVSIFTCIYFCSRRQRYHSTKIDPSMNTPRTRIFSIPKNDSFDRPTSNLELDIYEEIDDWNDNDFNKKREDAYLNPAVIRYT